jgi:CBS domain-containing protein
MKITDIMTKNPAYCTPETDLQSAARKMCDLDCGEIPVVDDAKSMMPVGVVTDRDITCRSVAKGLNPQELEVRDCMTSPAVTATIDASVEDCCEILARERIRRLPVVDGDGRLCGIVSQADIARRCGAKEAAEVLREVSLSSR